MVEKRWAPARLFSFKIFRRDAKFCVPAVIYEKRLFLHRRIQTVMSTEMLETIREYFKTQPVLKAWLFGSFARGEETEDSDVDILVELDYSKPVGLEFVQMQLDLQSLLRKPIDLVSNRGLSKYIRPYIETDKILLYEC